MLFTFFHFSFFFASPFLVLRKTQCTVGGCFSLLMKFATSLLALLAGGKLSDRTLFYIFNHPTNLMWKKVGAYKRTNSSATPIQRSAYSNIGECRSAAIGRRAKSFSGCRSDNEYVWLSDPKILEVLFSFISGCSPKTSRLGNTEQDTQETQCTL